MLVEDFGVDFLKLPVRKAAAVFAGLTPVLDRGYSRREIAKALYAEGGGQSLEDARIESYIWFLEKRGFSVTPPNK